MIIPLRCEGDCASWQLIELQGVLESDGDKDGLELGKLAMKHGRPTLEIANHVLTGKMIKLPKPLAIVLKKKSEFVTSEPATKTRRLEGSTRISEREHLDYVGVEYEVVGFVKEKMLFKDRPMNIMKKAVVVK